MKNLNSTALKVSENQLWILDQTQLPKNERWVLCDSLSIMLDVIKSLKVRGAPLIGVAASLFFALHGKQENTAEELIFILDELINSRPTAVNLSFLLNEHKKLLSTKVNMETHIALAERHFFDDCQLCENIASHGSNLLKNKQGIITHCNTGSLATAGVGTALGVIKKLYLNQTKPAIYVDETRPLLQGSRLTAWELMQAQIPYQLICDNMAANLMRQGKIDAVIVGADRICRNGDFANKIGTYGLAVLAHYHNIPFYVAAPMTTVDLHCTSGDSISIEQRDSCEVSFVHSSGERLQIAPLNTLAYNPAFEVTPAHLVTSYIFDTGIFKSSDLNKFNDV